MMPIRGDIHVAVEYGQDPETMTLRDVVEWYKKVVAASKRLGTATSMEVKHVDQAWGHLMQKIAEREGVPQGFLAYLLTELARTEMRVLEESVGALRTIAEETGITDA